MVWPLTRTSFVRGGGRYVGLFNEFGTSAASSYEALGITPGSVKVVRSKELIVKKYKTAPTIGIMGFMRVARNGQLHAKQDIEPRRNTSYNTPHDHAGHADWVITVQPDIPVNWKTLATDAYFSTARIGSLLCWLVPYNVVASKYSIFNNKRICAVRADPSLRLAGFLISLILIRLPSNFLILVLQQILELKLIIFVEERQLQISMEDVQYS
uniref:Uncharacterized protein n=1 Tax=Glossina pallidipes TaxID=7398 RepID=A0A1A9Z8Y4_GLOPL